MIDECFVIVMVVENSCQSLYIGNSRHYSGLK
jgi:hypothetical protein